MLTSTQTLRLQDWGVIRAAGADAASFLHGQLTQDFALLGREQARLAAFCTPKGRMRATMVGWRANDDEILLALPASTLPATLKKLSMFVLRAKCKLSDASAEFALYGELGGAAAPAWSLSREPLAEGGERVRIALPSTAGTQRALVIAPASAAAWPETLSPQDWAWAEVSAGTSWVQEATVEAFVPQMVNFEVLGGVNFKKGCYPGQEIVARSQYRGTLKRRLQIFSSTEPAQVGQEIFHSADPDQPAGMVAGSASRAGQTLLVAEVKLAALEGGSLHLGSASGPALSLQALPYEIPPQE